MVTRMMSGDTKVDIGDCEAELLEVVEIEGFTKRYRFKVRRADGKGLVFNIGANEVGEALEKLKVMASKYLKC